MKGTTRFDQYLRSLGIPIHGVAGPAGADCVINFAPSATAEHISQANAARASFDWADKPDPNAQSFMELVVSAICAGNIPVVAGPYLFLFVPIVSDYNKRKQLWTRIKTQMNPGSGLITAIENGAAQFDMPIV